MTLPIQAVCRDSAVAQLRGAGSRRGRPCLSAAWADPPPLLRRERRKAIYSWSVGCNTLAEFEELPARQENIFKKGKVADNATLLEPRGRRLVTTLPQPHAASPSLVRRPSPLTAMPGLKGLATRRRSSGTTTTTQPLRKCETVVTLTTDNGTTSRLLGSSSGLSVSEDSLQHVNREPVQATNRLRVSPQSSRMCSRCSSLLTLASSSRYSLNSTLGFVPVTEGDSSTPLLCKLCLSEEPFSNSYRFQQCNCSFCIECMKSYVEFEIAEGAYDIACPDAQCPSQGVLQQEEIKRLAGSELYEKHKKYRLNREIELDQSKTWCPRAGCETVCAVCPTRTPQAVHCPTCTTDFCSSCKLEWHSGVTCEANNKSLVEAGNDAVAGLPFHSDLIKCCPMCNVPIEKDEGCAQMMCKRCKHVFCWYCLASLDDDFLLRHYDKGPCKNKLGHSRASVIWHRTQVIGIFAGFGILLLVASPLLLLAAPCIVCCKCRVCNAGNTKLDNEEETEEVQASANESWIK